jgi:NAD(P)-dependent dehydrogenase (short-subunit alcohol dehydrogenase family)
MSGQLAGKVAIVTGGGSGIGRALCLGLAREDASIVVCDVDRASAEVTVAEITREGQESRAVTLDVSQADQVQAMVDSVIATEGQIDILVNAAGIWPRKPFLEVTQEEWQHVLDINLTGTFLCCRAVAPHMMEQGGGKIVNLASGRGVAGAMNGVHYASSKGGVIALTVSLGMELGDHGINVNAVAPGGTETPLFRGGRPEGWEPPTDVPPNRRIEEPESVVGPVLFLVTDASKTMFGECIFMKAP